MGRSVPSRVSRQWLSSVTPPFPPVGPGEPGSPPFGTMTALRLPVRVFSGRLCVRFRSPCAPPVFVSALALPRQRRTAIEPGTIVRPASHFRRDCTWTRAGPLRFPGDPSRIFALLQDPGRTDAASPLTAWSMLPRSQHSEGFGVIMISGLTHGFDACCLRFTSDVAAARARLASGWRAAPLPGGSRTPWIASKGFRSTYLPPFQGLP
jgi:hypothetical protein